MKMSLKRTPKAASPSQSLLATKARKRLVLAVAAVKTTPELELKASRLADKARKAKHADFLEKYRYAAAA